MADITTAHWNEDGEQVTGRTVTLSDAAGEEHDHAFRVDDGEHEYLGDADPSEAALDALAEAGFIEQESEEGQSDE